MRQSCSNTRYMQHRHCLGCFAGGYQSYNLCFSIYILDLYTILKHIKYLKLWLTLSTFNFNVGCRTWEHEFWNTFPFGGEETTPIIKCCFCSVIIPLKWYEENYSKQIVTDLCSVMFYWQNYTQQIERFFSRKWNRIDVNDLGALVAKQFFSIKGTENMEKNVGLVSLFYVWYDWLHTVYRRFFVCF